MTTDTKEKSAEEKSREILDGLLERNIAPVVRVTERAQRILYHGIDYHLGNLPTEEARGYAARLEEAGYKRR